MSTHNTWPITTPKHTPEPWMATSSGLVVHDADVLAECRPETGDAARIVACVNALAGVEDPAAFVEAVRDWVNALAPGAPPLSPPAALGHWASVRSHLID